MTAPCFSSCVAKPPSITAQPPAPCFFSFSGSDARQYQRFDAPGLDGENIKDIRGYIEEPEGLNIVRQNGADSVKDVQWLAG
ncbi:hypothetical protein SDJN03_06524, partial [Cucurbita argyrosperma subsp. sororia]